MENSETTSKVSVYSTGSKVHTSRECVRKVRSNTVRLVSVPVKNLGSQDCCTKCAGHLVEAR